MRFKAVVFVVLKINALFESYNNLQKLMFYLPDLRLNLLILSKIRHMKKICILLFLFAFTTICYGQTKVKTDSLDFTKPQIVETACGECKFHLKGDDCDLAIRVNGRAYFVDGTNIDDHGDAHAKDGFCNSIKKAKVTGKIVKGRFKASSFQLLK